MQKNRYQRRLSDVCIMCQKTGIIKFCLRWCRKTDIIEFCLKSKKRYSIVANRCHWILSDVNIIRCRKTDIIEFCLMLISSDAEKQTTLNFVCVNMSGITEFSLILISSEAEKQIPLKLIISLMFIWADAEKHILLIFLMLISLDAEKQDIEHVWKSSAVKRDISLNFVWCRKKDIIISSDAEKQLALILSDVNIIRWRKTQLSLYLVWG